MICPVVEGYGEVEAVPVLLRRLAVVHGMYDIAIRPPIRRKRGSLVKFDDIQYVTSLVRIDQEATAVMYLFDADDDCPCELAPEIIARINAHALQIPATCVIANREYESWFLAGIDGIAAHYGRTVNAPPDCDAIRGAKGHLERLIDTHYNERLDQPRFSALMNLETCYARSRSFRKFVKEFRSLMIATGREPLDWPGTHT